MLISGADVFLNGRFCHRDILVQDGKIAELAKPGDIKETGEEVIFAEGKRILPGLVDIHSHGRNGQDFSLATEKDLTVLCKAYASCGVTAVLATMMTNRPEILENSVDAAAQYIRKKVSCGAKLVGIHLEGPFLGKEKRGAHDEQYLRRPDKEWFAKLKKISGNNIRLVTLDPRLEGAKEFIGFCRAEDCRVSLGHTACTYEEALTAAKAGADHVTHLFNAMNSIHHREPGLIGAAWDAGMYTELICDGIHVHPALIRMLFAAHPEKVLLISDSMPAAGLSDGAYELGGLPVYVKEGQARQADGTLAGSTISLYDAMVNCIRFGIPAEAAVYSATYLPAKSVGLEHVVGSIDKGRTADFLVVSEEWQLEKVVINGACI